MLLDLISNLAVILLAWVLVVVAWRMVASMDATDRRNTFGAGEAVSTLCCLRRRGDRAGWILGDIELTTTGATWRGRYGAGPDPIDLPFATTTCLDRGERQRVKANLPENRLSLKEWIGLRTMVPFTFDVDGEQVELAVQSFDVKLLAMAIPVPSGVHPVSMAEGPTDSGSSSGDRG